MIAKPILIFKCDCYKIGNDRPYHTTYVQPENIHYWIGAPYEDDGEQLIITKVWVQKSRYENLFN